MPETGTTATPPAASGGFTKEQLDAAIAEALKPITAGIKTVTDGHNSLANVVKGITDASAAAPAEADKKGKPEALTADAAKQLFGDLLKQHSQQQQQTAQQQQAREQFKATRLQNFPPAYADRLGNDSSKWEDEAKQIAATYAEDGKKFGWKPAAPVGQQTTGASPVQLAAPDLSKMSPQQLAEMALKTSKPVGGGATSTTAPAAAASNQAAGSQAAA